jgi:hypothetical protein
MNRPEDLYVKAHEEAIDRTGDAWTRCKVLFPNLW